MNCITQPTFRSDTIQFARPVQTRWRRGLGAAQQAERLEELLHERADERRAQAAEGVLLQNLGMDRTVFAEFLCV